jgi:hypothetical protein
MHYHQAAALADFDELKRGISRDYAPYARSSNVCTSCSQMVYVGLRDRDIPYFPLTYERTIE